MRKLVLKMSVSLDGFVGGPNGEIDWLLRTQDDDAIAWVETTLWQAGVHIMGSRTFHDMAAYWPNSTDKLAAPMNQIEKVVFSRKGIVEQTTPELTSFAFRDASRIKLEQGMAATVVSTYASTWTNVPVANGDLAEEISLLKKQNCGIILAHGGAGFARNLVRSGLIDEYRLLIHPVLLGKGLPLFSGLEEPVYLKLVQSTSFKSGTIANIYHPVNH